MTILRRAEYAALKGTSLSGKVLDLGGEERSGYHALFTGEFSVTTANLDAATNPDIVCDLEHPLTLPTASYDHVLLINVLEHIFEYRQLLTEAARVLRPGGSIVIVVPFLFPLHASPHDFHRYSAQALERALASSGFSNVHITVLGSGVCAARWVLLERLFPFSLLSSLIAPLATLLDILLTGIAHLFGKRYVPSDYPLGYVVTATK